MPRWQQSFGYIFPPFALFIPNAFHPMEITRKGIREKGEGTFPRNFLLLLTRSAIFGAYFAFAESRLGAERLFSFAWARKAAVSHFEW